MKKRRLVTIALLAIALVVVVAGMQLVQPSPFGNPMDGANNVLAEGPGTGCSGCHASVVTWPCLDCHPMANTGEVIGALGDVVFDKHHAGNNPQPWEIGNNINDYKYEETCQTAECHGYLTNPQDARYAARPDPYEAAHQDLPDGDLFAQPPYCLQCHESEGVAPPCGDCHIGM